MARMRQMESAHKKLVRKPQDKEPLLRIILKCVLQKLCVSLWAEFYWLRIGYNIRLSEYGNSLTGFVQSGNVLSSLECPKHRLDQACNFNTLWTGDADLRLYITTVQDG